MATRLYLDGAADTVPITPTPEATWTDTSMLQRTLTRTTKTGEALATRTLTETTSTLKWFIFNQYISPPLTPGQSILGTGTYKGQCRVSETTVGNNMFFSVGIRIFNETTLKATLKAAVAAAGESVVALTNSQWSKAAAVTYTTVANDRLVIEIGMEGDPTSSNPHSSAMRLGSSSATDLGENTTETTDNNPWVELPDTLTFGSLLQSPTDTATLSDSATRAITPAKSDTVTLSDTAQPTMAVKPAKSDTVTLSDLATPVLTVGWTQSAADTATLTDVEAAVVVSSRADTITLTDAATSLVVSPHDDTIILTDSEVSLVTSAQADTVVLADSEIALVGSGQSDAVTPSDSETALVGQAQADEIALSDLAVLTVGTSAADAVTLLDSETTSVVLSLGDTVTIADVATPVLNGGGINYTLELGDTTTLLDENSKIIGQATSDGIVLSEGISRFGRTLADTISLSDQMVYGIGLNLSDQVGLVDHANLPQNFRGGLLEDLCVVIGESL